MGQAGSVLERFAMHRTLSGSQQELRNAAGRALPAGQSPLTGRCGVSPLEGVGRDGVGSAAGEGFPHPQILVLWLRRQHRRDRL